MVDIRASVERVRAAIVDAQSAARPRTPQEAAQAQAASDAVTKAAADAACDLITQLFIDINRISASFDRIATALERK